MLRVISFKICPFVQRVTAALEARGVRHKVEFISLRDKPQWFLDIAPTGQVPVLVTESGAALFESDAIVEYIDDFYGPLEDNLTPEQKAFDRAWSYQASKHYLVQCGTMRSDDEDTLKAKAENLEKAFARAEAQLGDGPYFKGSVMSKIDIAWIPLLHRAEIVMRLSGYDFFDKYPKVKAWQGALLSTRIPEKAVSDDFEEVFSGFYMAKTTYLGKLKDSLSATISTAAATTAVGVFEASGAAGTDEKLDTATTTTKPSAGCCPTRE